MGLVESPYLQEHFDFQPKIKAQVDPLKIPDHTMQFEYSNKKLKLSGLTIDEAFIKNGRKNYDIYCSACHTKTGDGTKSIISQNGWIVSNILENVTANKSDSELYQIIKNGVRTMPGYGKKLDSKEIWEIVVYVRALQRMTRATNYDRQLLKRRASQ